MDIREIATGIKGERPIGWFVPFTEIPYGTYGIYRRLIMKAIAVRENAYAPVTDICVGSAIESITGNIYVGCNVEADTLSQTIHAEQNAIGAMIAGGDYKPLRVAIAVARRGTAFDIEHTAPVPVNLSLKDFPPTCGHCLQIILQHCQKDPNVELISVTPEGGVYITTMGAALPMPFQIAHLPSPRPSA